MNYPHRDIKILNIYDNQRIVVACDSCGGIGSKQNDFINITSKITGQLTTRVCLMELLSAGATPKVITANICNEPYPTGEEILSGITQEISTNNLSCEIVISTEKNIPTSMTALGITAIGSLDIDTIPLGRVNTGNYIYLLGIPYVGEEVLENYNSLPNLKHISYILDNQKANEILPIGSKGIKGELDGLASSYRLKYDLIDQLPTDINKSGGPCTALLVICDDELDITIDIPLNLIGRIK